MERGRPRLGWMDAVKVALGNTNLSFPTGKQSFQHTSQAHCQCGHSWYDVGWKTIPPLLSLLLSFHPLPPALHFSLLLYYSILPTQAYPSIVNYISVHLTFSICLNILYTPLPYNLTFPQLLIIRILQPHPALFAHASSRFHSLQNNFLFTSKVIPTLSPHF